MPRHSSSAFEPRLARPSPIDVAGSAVWPIDRLTAAYLLISGLALSFPHRPPSWPWLVAAHVTGALVLLRAPPFGAGVRFATRRAPRLARLLHHWYPLLVMPFLYAELAVLNVAVHNGRYFDAGVISLEQSVFGGQPSRALAGGLPNLFVSETLHAAYLSYYLIIYVPPLLLFLAGRHAEFRRVLLALMATFFAHYVFFVYLPVQGPRYLWPSPVVEAARGPMWSVAQRLLEAGSSRGAAFPSSHVGVAVAQTLCAFAFLPRLAPILTIVTAGLALGAVYGGFHYATDVLAGLILGASIALAVARGSRAVNAQ